jgi:3-dehydroquinate synthase
LVRVTVQIPERSYDVTIGPGLIGSAADILGGFGAGSRAFVVADRGSERYFEALSKSLERIELPALLLRVPRGEEAKKVQVYETVLRELAQNEAHRDDPVFALGGGAVGDLAGFVAGTYMRGVPLVQVPTTLLAQVDASVGGKTAVNLPQGKNLVGTFYQPRAVLSDVEALKTLPVGEFASGLAEVVKYALTLDPELLGSLERDPGPVLRREPAALEGLVARCVAAKAGVVSADETDRDQRLVLNYGHTLGHALERLDSFAGRSHGEAIAAGMMFAARLSERTGLAEDGIASRTARLLSSLGLDPEGGLPGAADILSSMRMDKKFRSGLRFVLLKEVGKPMVVEDVSVDDVRASLEEMGASP